MTRFKPAPIFPEIGSAHPTFSHGSASQLLAAANQHDDSSTLADDGNRVSAASLGLITDRSVSHPLDGRPQQNQPTGREQ